MMTFKPNKSRTALVCDPLGGSTMNPRKEKPPTRESQIEKRLVQRVKDTGGECRKVRWIGRPGATDRVIMRDGDKEAVDFLKRLGVSHLSDEDVARVARIVVGQYILWPELKAPGKKPEPHQVREHARMRKMGQRVEVVDNYERIEEILK